MRRSDRKGRWEGVLRTEASVEGRRAGKASGEGERGGMHDEGGGKQSDGCLVHACTCSEHHEAVSSDSCAKYVCDGLVEPGVYERGYKGEKQTDGEKDLALPYAKVSEGLGKREVLCDKGPGSDGELGRVLPCLEGDVCMSVARVEDEEVEGLPVTEGLVAVLDDGVHCGGYADDDEEAKGGRDGGRPSGLLVHAGVVLEEGIATSEEGVGGGGILGCGGLGEAGVALLLEAQALTLGHVRRRHLCEPFEG